MTKRPNVAADRTLNSTGGNRHEELGRGKIASPVHYPRQIQSIGRKRLATTRARTFQMFDRSPNALLLDPRNPSI